MLDTKVRQSIHQLINKEVIPALGCTEPISVALAVAKTSELLGETPTRFEVILSPNILKNAMGVGIPGTGMAGLPIAIALGSIMKGSEKGLEILRGVSDAQVEEGRKFIASNLHTVKLKEDAPSKLFIEIIGESKTHKARVIISKEHDRFTFLEQDGQVLLDEAQASESNERGGFVPDLNFSIVYEYATTSPISELSFILKTVELNKTAAQESLKGTYGHGVAHTLAKTMMCNNVYSDMLSVTTAACDARMAGAEFIVMSNSGSGNQGIAATLPVSVYAEENGKSEEDLIRALILSHLMTIYMKQSLGRLSGLCGVVLAATGSSCGITYLMGGDKEQIGYSIKNMIGNITGIICDGAKPSCALKVANGVNSAIISSLMSMDNKVISPIEGITEADIDKTIQNLTKIGREGMQTTDRMILDIMTAKQ